MRFNPLASLFGPHVTGAGAAGLLLLRLVAGTAFMVHGWPKIQNPFGWMGPDAPFPGILLALAALSEFGGGLAWILGLLTPLASLGILSTMVVATWTHISRGDPFVGQGASYELALVYLAVAFLFLVQGAGVHSLDAQVFGKSRRAREGVPRPETG
jgi:putative oxidoreductase